MFLKLKFNNRTLSFVFDLFTVNSHSSYLRIKELKILILISFYFLSILLLLCIIEKRDLNMVGCLFVNSWMSDDLFLLQAHFVIPQAAFTLDDSFTDNINGVYLHSDVCKEDSIRLLDILKWLDRGPHFSET